MTHIEVDFNKCTGNALCMGIAPEIFEVRDDGYLYVLDENPGPQQDEDVYDAERACPNAAITVRPSA